VALKICTSCGYEGKAIKPPSDIAGESDNEVKKAFDKLCRMIFLATGIPVKPIAMALVLPVYLVLWPLKGLLGASSGPKFCPNCSLPTMVGLKTDAGWLAKRKNDIKTGAWIPPGREEEEKLGFGKEVILPGDRKKNAPPPAERLKSLPTLEEMLKEPQVEAPVEPAPETPVDVKKKTVDPDQW